MFPGLKFERLNFTPGKDRFGFASRAQALKWYNKKELDWYATKGYTLNKHKGVTITARSNKQVTFIKP